MDEKLDIIAIGESLVEFSTDLKMSIADNMQKYYGGDALAAAVAAQRMGSNVGFITRVGNDAFKEYLLESWRDEGLDTSQVKLANEPNGLYFIARSSLQDKEVAYYRRKIAPSKLSLEDISQDYIKNSKALYASGLMQSLSLSASEAVREAFKMAKQNGVITAYDPNYFPQITSATEAKEAFESVISDIDVLFMSTKYDTVNFFEINSVENIIKKIWDLGVSTVVIKCAEKGGYYTGYNGNIVFTEFYTTDVLDTTSSGDAFNGGFLHALVTGLNPFESAKFASIVAGLQAKKIGAIKSIPFKNDVYAIYHGDN
ncbi:MAG: sugar kinase [Candidatus Gastranaerophilales bacterium]